MASNFWENVQKILNQMGQTQKWLADQTEMKRQTINNGINKTYRGQDSQPGVNDAYKIAKALDVTLEYLVTGKDPEGLPPEIILIAKELAKLTPPERDEIMAMIRYKLSKRPTEATDTPDVPESPVSPPSYAQDPAPDYPGPPRSPVHDPGESRRLFLY